MQCAERGIGMSDKELLELAAKAAGVEIYDSSDAGIKLRGSLGLWNPLTDDGDALRLAVKLNLSIGIHCNRSGVVEVEHGFDTSGTARYYLCQDAPEGGDDYAATRRAIVRAAAEIGRGL